MTERCTFYRLGRDAAKQLFACRTPESLREFVTGLETTETPRVESDAAALALHRVLTDGSLEPLAGEYPLNHAVLGGRVLGHDTGFAVVLKRPDMSPHIAEGLARVTPETVEAMFSQLHAAQPDLMAGIESSDISRLLADLTSFYQAAAAAGEAVVLVRREAK
jgi:hypothetical protein